MAFVSLQIDLEDYLVRGHSLEEQKRLIREGVIIGDYLNGDLSIGGLTKALGLGFDETKKWLEDRGVPLLRRLPPHLEKIVEKNMQELAEGKLKHLNFDPGENQQLLMEAEVCFQEKMKNPEFKKAWENEEPREEIEKEPRQAVKERLIVHAYVQGNISLGAAAEMLGLWYEETMHWFSGQRIATLRSLPPELEEITRTNAQELLERLKLKFVK
ncbi:MAG: UPF0175 family protein [Deltaproteobacteria bacterium]|nr:UPF0175 family protein [Deltaproteobacteria bacterium]